MAQVLSLMETLSSDKSQFRLSLKMIENKIPAGAPNKSRRPVGALKKRCGHTHRFSE